MQLFKAIEKHSLLILEMSRSRNYVFTINNYTDETVQVLRTLGVQASTRYIVFGREVATTGTPHLQGYVEFLSGVSVAAATRRLGGRAFVEARMGSALQAANYAKKDGDYEEQGVISSPGRRSDLDDLKNDLEAGNNLRSVSRNHFGNFIRYQRGILAWRSLNSEPRNFKTEVRVYHGAAGTGKSRRAFQEAEDPWIWGGDSWFDGYDEHPHAIMDDFRGSAMKPSMLLKITDRYPMRVPVKGAFVNWRPRILWITSNVTPEDWYPNVDQETRNAIMRRIDVNIGFAADGFIANMD